MAVRQCDWPPNDISTSRRILVKLHEYNDTKAIIGVFVLAVLSRK